MCRILLSINPEHVENILNGSKCFEYRKVKAKREVDRIIIYATFPIMKVVGEAEVVDILYDKPDRVWNATYRKSGISKDFYNLYYNGREAAVAYKLGKIIHYDHPRSLDEFGLSVAPQSYAYVE